MHNRVACDGEGHVKKDCRSKKKNTKKTIQVELVNPQVDSSISLDIGHRDDGLERHRDHYVKCQTVPHCNYSDLMQLGQLCSLEYSCVSKEETSHCDS